MSIHDDRLVESSTAVRSALADLQRTMELEEQAKADKKDRVRRLINLGLSSRYVASKVGVSHVTILAWYKDGLDI